MFYSVEGGDDGDDGGGGTRTVAAMQLAVGKNKTGPAEERRA